VERFSVPVITLSDEDPEQGGFAVALQLRPLAHGPARGQA
jgi:hypothetical protein